MIPNLTITPANKADKLNITYQNTSNESTSIIANKINDNWSLNSNVDGITIEPQSGLVTINYQVVYPESVVVANDTTVNSDTSEESRENMPRKEATPEAPDIEANEEHVNVEVTPKGEASKVEIIYINPENEPASINAIKNGETWTLDKQVSHINIDGHTGKVTVGYQAVQAESEIVATETKGNSDSSSESKLKMPRKEVTPEAPDVEASEEQVNVEVTPKDDSTKLIINYTDTNGQSSSIIASKNGGVWSLDKQVSHVELDDQTGKITIGYQAVQAESEVATTETKGNSDSSSESKLKMPRKEATPEAPDIKASEEHVNVEITPKGESTNLEVKYTDTNGQPSSIIASKNGGVWSLNKEVPHIELDETNGKVTIGYQAVQAESEVIATETKGNSNPSTESKVTMPRKEATPEAPDVEASEEQVNVEVTPKDDSTKLIINYTDTNGQSSSIIASKNGGVWSLDKQVPHIELDETNGKVTIGYQAVQAESEIIATETKGNSNSSTESKVTMPRKETTPEAPTIEADEEHANVEVTPKDEVTKLVINYTNQEGQTDSIIANKNDGTWSLNKKVSHVELDNQTSKITIGYQAVQAESEIVTTEIKGNSDPSIESKVNMPRKEVAPDGPTLTSDYDNVSVSISPSNKSDKMTIKYLDVNDQIATAIATKTNQNWSLNNDILGFSINSQTGKVTISHVAVQPESDIIATESGGNSDDSIAKHIIMPAKETKPEPPVVQSNINVPNVEIIPHHDVTKLDIHYTDIEGQPAIITATKVGKLWNINKNISNIELDESTGKVTIGYQTVQAASEVEATETKGNSDASAKSKVTMPRKEATPDAPTIEASEEQVNVEVTPKDESTKLVINYTNPEGQTDSIIASKNGETWSLNKEVPYIQLNETTGKVTIGYKAVRAESEVVATETKGNSDTSVENKINMPRKEVMPDSPVIEADEEHANVEVTPKDESTKLVINYTNPEGQTDSIIASKNGETWSLNKGVPYIQLNETTGKVTIGYQAVQSASEVEATETKGNSDASAKSKVTIPRKGATPDTPTIEASEEQVNVEVTPKDEATKLVINYTNPEGQSDSIIASKNGEIWSLNKEVPNIQLNETTGKVKIGYQAVLAGSEISATETKGNSDASMESKVNMPIKVPTPDAPIIEKYVSDASVGISPKGEVTQLIIKYITPEGKVDSIIASKNEETWSLNKEVPHIQLDKATGKVIIGYQVVQAGSEVIAIATQGNSDASTESNVNMPIKEVTPNAPAVEASESHVYVEVTPKDESTKLVINYTNPEGQTDSIIASKNGETWSLNKEVPHIQLDKATGKVKIGYQAVQAESEIVATETKGNSDTSTKSKIIMPRKEATPDAPIVEKDERDVNVSIVPSGLSTKLEINYLNPKGQSEKILVNKNGHIWSLSKEITGITLEPTTGKVTIDYQVVYPESKITASGLKGNSDYSKLNSVIMPRKEKAPEPPIVTINEEEATVIIKPKTEATKVKINFKNKKGKMTYINIYKNGSEWSTDQVIKGIILNSHTGEIKITNLAIEERSEIVAREYKGNSDASVAIIIKVPSKVTNREVYKIKTSKVKLNDGSNEIKHIEKDKLKELPHTGENNQTNKTLLSSILILGLMLLRKSRKKEI
ncbi:LPXTG cell wall anchor domain-containing protein [Staphylococcus capitis]|uniref:LPXTG cell wall anchor domain-containing protein n=1 Tax=Staphylococcus capitis TaxID=29388 RepID=UPI0012FD3AC1|nr:LPXTG cell wall anchor domain-containing protein [Staphylococcus capitis]MBO0371851.1 LPXTG cell wall anchor domain-containing protein [Staphylococcus capitis]MCM3283840.1 LPXTG cell wall anchor domain-containing protein [Staphylococcus capitis]MDS3981486.1 LPXTG cell wall anchor domain-containing protein [Staphylococcus capitis]MDS4053044.1 LPXTG cell wall anchor domain-containing protein [Staphylococcus capitis]